VFSLAMLVVSQVLLRRQARKPATP
jgi:hypothetical protein